MAYKAPKTFNIPKADALKFWPPSPVLLNGGINLVDKEWKLSDSQTSKVLNMWFYQGELSKRWGQEYVNVDIGSPIFNAYRYKFKDKIVFHCNTKLYTLDTETGTTTEIYSNLTAAKGSFFKFNGKLYYINGHEYIQWDGTTATPVEPYIPTVIINRTPTGGGDVNEDYNRLGKAFKNSFNGNGTATVYQLTDTNLDTTLVTATIDGVTKVETTDFTVNRITGTVTFTSAPTTGTNNVIITAYKTVQADINTILNCLYAIPFGGQNNNRVFFAGNGSGYYYWTGISAAGVDPTYFAYNNYNIIGLTDEDITGLGKHYDILTIHKESGEIYAVTYAWDGTKGIFGTYNINTQYGCDCPDTIQNINNNLVWLNSRFGVCILVRTDVENQRNVFPISRNTNPRLMAESNLKNATSLDFNGKYWLCVNDKVYLWDYFISPYVDTGDPDQSAQRLSWWYFENINASCWIVDSQNLYYGSKAVGRIVKFHNTYDTQQYYDFGGSIPAVYRYPVREMGDGIYEFSVLKGFLGVKGDNKTYFNTTYFTSDDFNGDPSTEDVEVGSFAFDTFTWDTFIWDVMGDKFEAVLVPGAKNIRYFGAEFYNNEAGKDMNISSLQWQYKLTKLVK